MKNFRNNLSRRSLYSCTKAVAFIEFALVLPVILIIAFATIEISRYAQFKQKVDNASASIINLINQTDRNALDGATLDYISAIFPEAMKPYTSTDWEVVITAVFKKGDIDCQVYSLWQVERGHVDYKPQRKSLVAEGENKEAEINNYTNQFGANDQLITVELFLNYYPILDNFITRSIGLGKEEMYSIFISRPRYGSFMRHPETGEVISPVCKLSELDD